MLVPHAFPLCSGRILPRPEDFRVTEMPLAMPAGQGDFVLVEVTKSEVTTPFLVMALADWLGVPPTQIGYAGLKNRRALTTQWLSLPAACAERLAEKPELPGLVSWRVQGRHPHPLKTGQLAGNRYEIRIATEAELGQHVSWLRQHGFANYFGQQRFGGQDKVAQGNDILAGASSLASWKRALALAAWQSDCFNRYLRARIQAGAFERLLDGDLAQNLQTGALFPIETATAEQERLEAFEISPTGPLPGDRLRRPHGPSAKLELPYAPDSPVLRREQVRGMRRPIRLPVADLACRQDGEQVLLSFSLPQGSLASVLLGHIFAELGPTLAVDEEQEELFPVH